jgi:hypothetical protein
VADRSTTNQAASSIPGSERNSRGKGGWIDSVNIHRIADTPQQSDGEPPTEVLTKLSETCNDSIKISQKRVSHW